LVQTLRLFPLKSPAWAHESGGDFVKTINYYYLEDEQQWLGYLQDHPDYWEEAETFDSLQANLSSLSFDHTLLNILKDRKAA
jgi:hypothetical protein